MKMMRLLVISTDRTVFDDGSAVRQRLLEQAELVPEMDVIVLTPKDIRFEPLHLGHRLRIHPTSSSSKFAYLSDAYRLGCEILAKKHTGKWLISAQDPFETGALAYLLARKFKVPLHLQLHTDPWSKAWKSERFINRLRFLLALFLLTRADSIRVVSERLLRSVRKLGIPEERITKVPIFVDVERFMTAKPAFDLHRSYPLFSRIILSMGRLQPEKNYKGLVRAFRDVRKEFPEAMLLIVGSGPERDALITYARMQGLSDEVVFLPWARDVASYYKTCDIYVQPSRYEGWGMAVIEAMASGAPVVMTNVGCAGEVVRNGETGIVVPPENDKVLAEAMRALLADETLRATLSSEGKNEVKKLATKAETLMLYKASWEKAFEHGRTKTTE